MAGVCLLLMLLLFLLAPAQAWAQDDPANEPVTTPAAQQVDDAAAEGDVPSADDPDADAGAPNEAVAVDADDSVPDELAPADDEAAMLADEPSQPKPEVVTAEETPAALAVGAEPASDAVQLPTMLALKSSESAAVEGSDGAVTGQDGQDTAGETPQGDIPASGSVAEDDPAVRAEKDTSVYVMLNGDATTLVFDSFDEDEQPTIDGVSPAWYYRYDSLSSLADGMQVPSMGLTAQAPWSALSSTVQKVLFKCAVQPASTSGWFANFTRLQQVEYGAQGTLDLSQATTLANMFNGCSSLVAVDVSKWDLSNATSINGTFAGCSSLTSLDVSQWNTSNITDMGNLFSGCAKLTGIDVSKWDTSKVTNMSGMFQGCTALKAADVAKWNTSNVSRLDRLFDGCTSLSAPDISTWDVGSVSDVNKTFLGKADAAVGITPREALTRYLMDHNQLATLLAALADGQSASGGDDGESSVPASEPASPQQEEPGHSSKAVDKSGAGAAAGAAGIAIESAIDAVVQNEANQSTAENAPAFGKPGAADDTSIESNPAPAASLSQAVDNALDALPGDWHRLALLLLGAVTLLVAICAALLVPRRQGASV